MIAEQVSHFCRHDIKLVFVFGFVAKKTYFSIECKTEPEGRAFLFSSCCFD